MRVFCVPRKTTTVFDRRREPGHNLRVAQDTEGQEWAPDLVRRVGIAIKKARGTRSANWLSDRTAALGYRISPSVIAKLDSGHRGSVLSVAELFVLAAALEVPPALLLFPSYPDGAVKLLPELEVWAWGAVDWLSGSSPLPELLDHGKSGDLPQPNNGTALVGAYARRRAVEDEIRRNEYLLYASSPGKTPEQVQRSQQRLRELQTDLASIDREIGQVKTALWGSLAAGADDA